MHATNCILCISCVNYVLYNRIYTQTHAEQDLWQQQPKRLVEFLLILIACNFSFISQNLMRFFRLFSSSLHSTQLHRSVFLHLCFGFQTPVAECWFWFQTRNILIWLVKSVNLFFLLLQISNVRSNFHSIHVTHLLLVQLKMPTSCNCSIVFDQLNDIP